MNINQLALDFMTAHINADDIVMDPETKLPVRAIYSDPDSTGNLRPKPSVFWFHPSGGATC